MGECVIEELRSLLREFNTLGEEYIKLDDVDEPARVEWNKKWKANEEKWKAWREKYGIAEL